MGIETKNTVDTAQEVSKEAAVDNLQKETKGLLGGLLGEVFGDKLKKVFDSVNNFFSTISDFFGGKKEEKQESQESGNNNVATAQQDYQNFHKKEIFKDVSQNTFTNVMSYLVHQQGMGGMPEILKAINENRQVSPNILKNMSYNVNFDEYNKMFHKNIKNREQLRQVLTPTEFVQYWINRYESKIAMGEKHREYDHIIEPLAKKYGVDSSHVRTTIAIESGFNAKAGNANYKGLMAIGAAEAKEMGFSPDDRMDPAKNLEMGIRLMARNEKTVDKNSSNISTVYAKVTDSTGGDMSNMA